MNSVKTSAIDFGNNAVWGSDWSRARESGNSDLAVRYEEIMQAQMERPPEVLQTAIRNATVSSGNDVELSNTTRQDMLDAVLSGRNYTLQAAGEAGSAGPASEPVELNPQQTAGYLLNDQWLRSDRTASLADLWRANNGDIA